MIYIAFLFITFALLAFVLYQWQHHMIFTPIYHRTKKGLGSDCTLLSMQSEDGVELEGVIYEPKDAENTLVVFVGRSHDGIALINRLSILYKKSRIITFNYRSYGKSGGVVSEKNVFKDALTLAKLIQKNYGDFYLLGFSIGSSIAAYLASHHKVKALFLVGAFDSIYSLAKSRFYNNIFIRPMIIKYKFETIKFVKEVQADTYLFVSIHDELTYIKNARNLKESVKNLQGYMELENLSHKEILWDERVVKKINEVMQR